MKNSPPKKPEPKNLPVKSPESSENKFSGNEEPSEKKRKRLPPTLSDIVYVAVISAPSSGKESNFEVYAISMSDYSIIRLKYSRKTRLKPGTLLDLRDFGDIGHYSIDDSIPLESLDKRVLSYAGTALVSAGEKHPIGLLKAQTMAEEGIKNLFVLLNMSDPEKLERFYEELKKNCFDGEIVHRDVFGCFIKAFPVKENPPDIRQQEALLKICGNNALVIGELIKGYLDYVSENDIIK
ncbi:hypothetical protein J2128_001693 [Methanomicrobium sp. W14]|uniref:hypothetical protein n=1 Tax=Methanomicrobium sp. W14 TaxID=2817839 RepID=UPI001AE6F281|nr:hypothetical protein [Methanomicrobium sp. W14]MBP2133739.1 hypothetical protein [Methanomicrobium sp. W14]